MPETNIIKKTRLIIFLITLFLLSVCFVILKSTADLDLWHRMAVGKIFVQLGSVIFHDIFTYFPAKDMWVDHEWLTGIIFYNLGHYFGDYGIISLQIMVVYTTMLLIWGTTQLILPENKYRISYFSVVLLGIIPGMSASLRCQAFTYLFFALWLYLLERIRRGERRFVWIFPATMLLWTNMHGGFLAGIGLIVFYIIGDFFNKRAIKSYLIILGLCLPVTLINPYGIQYWQYMLEAVTMKRPHITEWEPFKLFNTFYNEPGARIMFVVLALGVGYKLFRKSFKFDMVKLVALSITLCMAFRHERHMVFFVILAGCYCYRPFVGFLNAIYDKFRGKILGLIPDDRHEQAYFAKFTGVYGILIMLCIYIIKTTPIEIGMGFYPTREVEFLKINNISGNLYVPFNWGSYALWKLYPQNLVSMDGRYEETYTNYAYKDSCNLTFYEKGWDRVLNGYNHDILLLEVRSKIYKKIKTLPQWKEVYNTKKGAIFLPVEDKRGNWKMPVDDEEYYVKTKYENRIDF